METVLEADGAGSEVGEDPVSHDFDSFYRANFAAMVTLAVGVTGRRSGAEDLVQDAMLDAHRRWDRIGTYEAPRAWVRRVVIQRAQKVSKKGANERVAHLRSVGDARTVEITPAIDQRLVRALNSLPNQQRAVLALHYLEDLSVADTAQLLGVAEGTVKTHLSRGRAALAAALAPDAPTRTAADTPRPGTRGDRPT